MRKISDNRKFWQTVTPFISDKIKSKESIILVNINNKESNEFDVAKTFNEFFSNIVKNLEIPEYNVRSTYTLDYQVIQSYMQQ